MISAAELERWDRACLWHPFTPHSVYADERPLMVVAGEGHDLIDADGRRYLDGVGSLWCNLFGHRHPRIDAAIRDQLDRIAHATLLGNSCAPAVQLARRLVDLTPPELTRVFFSDNGSTACEVALKMAYQYVQLTTGDPRRRRFMALGNAYNGDTIGAVSVGGIDLFHARFRPMLFECVRAPSPYRYRDPHTDFIGEFEQLIRAHANELVAVIIEPGFQGAGGLITYPPGYLQQVGALCQELGVLLIFDEVASGMGRSGALFACEREGVTPDLLCIAKGLTGGYLPVAATLVRERIYAAFLGPPAAGRTFFHGHTYSGNALGCAAALATLDLFEDMDMTQKLPRTISQLRAALTPLAALPAVGEIRQYGLAVGIELVADRATRRPFPPARRMGMQVCSAARDRGVFLRPLGDVIVLMPPLSITAAEIETLVDAVAYGIERVCA